MPDKRNLLSSRPTLPLPPRPSKGFLQAPTTRVRAAVLGLGASTPAIAGNHMLNELSLPMLVMIAGGAMTIGTAAWARVLPRLGARAVARRRDAALVRRLARLCCLGDFPQRQKRVFDLVGFLASEANLSRKEQKLLATASMVHRIGLVSLPPCPSDDRNKIHRRAAAIAERLLSGPTALHRVATGMARAHEESWDGGGLPYGLAGQNIPFPARLLQVALALDALLPRTGFVPDRNALAVIAARIGEEGGRTLDPELVLLPFRHPGALERLLRSRLEQADQNTCVPTYAGWVPRMVRAGDAGAMLTPA